MKQATFLLSAGIGIVCLALAYQFGHDATADQSSTISVKFDNSGNVSSCKSSNTKDTVGGECSTAEMRTVSQFVSVTGVAVMDQPSVKK